MVVTLFFDVLCVCRRCLASDAAVQLEVYTDDVVVVSCNVNRMTLSQITVKLL